MTSQLNTEKKRISRINQNLSKAKVNSTNDDDVVSEIMESMRTMNQISALHKLAENKNTKNENETEDNLPGRYKKQNKSKNYLPEKKHPLMEKSQKKLRALKALRKIPKQRAHMGTLSPTPGKNAHSKRNEKEHKLKRQSKETSVKNTRTDQLNKTDLNENKTEAGEKLQTLTDESSESEFENFIRIHTEIEKETSNGLKTKRKRKDKEKTKISATSSKHKKREFVQKECITSSEIVKEVIPKGKKQNKKSSLKRNYEIRYESDSDCTIPELNSFFSDSDCSETSNKTKCDHRILPFHSVKSEIERNDVPSLLPEKFDCIVRIERNPTIDNKVSSETGTLNSIQKECKYINDKEHCKSSQKDKECEYINNKEHCKSSKTLANSSENNWNKVQNNENYLINPLTPSDAIETDDDCIILCELPKSIVTVAHTKANDTKNSPQNNEKLPVQKTSPLITAVSTPVSQMQPSLKTFESLSKDSLINTSQNNIPNEENVWTDTTSICNQSNDSVLNIQIVSVVSLEKNEHEPIPHTSLQSLNKDSFIENLNRTLEENVNHCNDQNMYNSKYGKSVKSNSELMYRTDNTKQVDKSTRLKMIDSKTLSSDITMNDCDRYVSTDFQNTAQLLSKSNHEKVSKTNELDTSKINEVLSKINFDIVRKALREPNIPDSKSSPLTKTDSLDNSVQKKCANEDLITPTNVEISENKFYSQFNAPSKESTFLFDDVLSYSASNNQINETSFGIDILDTVEKIDLKKILLLANSEDSNDNKYGAENNSHSNELIPSSLEASTISSAIERIKSEAVWKNLGDIVKQINCPPEENGFYNGVHTKLAEDTNLKYNPGVEEIKINNETDENNYSTNKKHFTLKKGIHMETDSLKTEIYSESTSDEIDVISTESIRQLNDEPKPRSVMPLFNLYAKELEQYNKLLSTELDVYAGLRELEKDQAQKLKSLKVAIHNYIAHDPCNQYVLNSGTDTDKNQVTQGNLKYTNSSAPSRQVNLLQKIICDNCGKPATSKCQGCARVFFCSQECGMKYWTDGHEANCGNMEQ